MTRSSLIRLVAFILAWPCLALFAQTNLVVNGSFESGLSSWSFGAVNEASAAGTCSYNAVTAPGTETLTSTAASLLQTVRASPWAAFRRPPSQDREQTARSIKMLRFPPEPLLWS